MLLTQDYIIFNNGLKMKHTPMLKNIISLFNLDNLNKKIIDMKVVSKKLVKIYIRDAEHLPSIFSGYTKYLGYFSYKSVDGKYKIKVNRENGVYVIDIKILGNQTAKKSDEVKENIKESNSESIKTEESTETIEQQEKEESKTEEKNNEVYVEVEPSKNDNEKIESKVEEEKEEEPKSKPEKKSSKRKRKSTKHSKKKTTTSKK